jgi:ABC-type branched-subunit amino acid transport system substrate-binding protein
MPRYKLRSIRSARTLAIAVAAVSLALGASACSSSSSSSSSGSTTNANGSATGSPIDIGIIVPMKAVVDYTEAVSAAKGAVRAINAAGGVNGHPLVLLTCNSALLPTTEEACDRQMIAAHPAAMVGNALYTAEGYGDSAFRSAGIVQIGNYPSGISETDPNSYLFFGGQTYANAGQIYGAQKWAGDKVGVVRLDFPYTAPYTAFYTKACPTIGCSVVSSTVIPSNDTTNFGPYAAQLLAGHPDVIVPDLGPLIIPLMATLDQLGFTGKIVAQDTNFTTKNFLAQPEKVQNQYIISTPFPPPFATNVQGIQMFLSEMKAEKAAGDADAPTYTNYSQTATMDAWLAVHVFAEIASKAHAYTASAFKQAIQTTHSVDTYGLTPTWDPNHVNFPPLPRASNDSWYFYTENDGSPKLLNTASVAVTPIVEAGWTGSAT